VNGAESLTEKWPIGLQKPGPTGLINTAPPLSKLPAYAGVSRTQPAVLAYGADQALRLIDTS